MLYPVELQPHTWWKTAHIVPRSRTACKGVFEIFSTREDEVVGRVGGERDPAARDGVRERERHGVEEHPPGRRGPPPVGCRVAVERVPHDGVAEMGGMDADLVGASRLDRELDERKPVVAL